MKHCNWFSHRSLGALQVRAAFPTSSWGIKLTPLSRRQDCTELSRICHGPAEVQSRKQELLSGSCCKTLTRLSQSVSAVSLYTDLSLCCFFDFNLCQQNLNIVYFFSHKGFGELLHIVVTCYTNKHDKSYKHTSSLVFDKSFLRKCHIYSTDVLIHIVK